MCHWNIHGHFQRLEKAMLNDLILALKAHVTAPPVPAVSEAAVVEAEARLGIQLPPLLRELYLQVSNGRFGPGYGILSVNNIGDGELSAIDLYLENRRDYPADPTWKWPSGLLPFCDWGCNIYSCVDCLHPPHPVSTFEYVSNSMANSFSPTRDSLEAWLRDWLAGIEVFEPVYENAPELDRVGRNPMTGEPMVIKGRRPRRR
jgi:hypothetical protein